jgi:hypothetical protein
LVSKLSTQNALEWEAELWQPTQKNTVLSPKPIHFGR